MHARSCLFLASPAAWAAFAATGATFASDLVQATASDPQKRPTRDQSSAGKDTSCQRTNDAGDDGQEPGPARAAGGEGGVAQAGRR